MLFEILVRRFVIFIFLLIIPAEFIQLILHSRIIDDDMMFYLNAMRSSSFLVFQVLIMTLFNRDY